VEQKIVRPVQIDDEFKIAWWGTSALLRIR
jgi:hypothetical protein